MERERDSEGELIKPLLYIHLFSYNSNTISALRIKVAS